MPNELVFGLAEGFGACAVDLIDLLEDARGDAQSGLGARALDGLQCGFVGIEHHAAPSALDLTEQAMLAGIPLRGIGRIVDDAQTKSQTPGQRDQFLLEAQGASGVGAAAVEQQHQLGDMRVHLTEGDLPGQRDGIADEGTGFARSAQRDETDVGDDVVDAVSKQNAVGEVAEVMVEDRLRIAAVALTGPVQGAERFLLLGVDTQHRDAALVRQATQGGNVAELLVTLPGVDAAGDQFLAQRPAAKAGAIQQLSRRIAAAFKAALEQFLLQLQRFQVVPAHTLIGGTAGTVGIEYIVQRRRQQRLAFGDRRPTAAGPSHPLGVAARALRMIGLPSRIYSNSGIPV